MSLHILLCDEVLLYFILRIGIIENLNLNGIEMNLQTIKDLENRKVFLFSISLG
jgi:hypothetical protein